MHSEFRCAGCIHGVLTGILPNGVTEYACCKSNDLIPFFYYDANPDRVRDCIDYIPLSRRSVPNGYNPWPPEGTYYEYEQGVE